MSSIFIDTNQLSKGAERFKNMSAELASSVDTVLDANVQEMAEKAKQNVPGDRGFLKQMISADTSKFLSKQITVNAPYAAYMEFGTGIYAAQYISTLPENWQSFALLFKGKGQGDYFDFLNAILDWVKRKGLSNVTNSYTGKKVGGKAAQENLLVLAETIAWSIIKKGVHPHPFLYPAFRDQLPQLELDLDNVLKDLGK
jgi:hypothetical protein